MCVGIGKIINQLERRWRTPRIDFRFTIVFVDATHTHKDTTHTTHTHTLREGLFVAVITLHTNIVIKF